MKQILGLALVSVIFVTSNASANGMCPFDEQGPLGCPKGTVWYAEFEVCLPPQELVG